MKKHNPTEADLNVESINQVPRRLLPDGPARDALVDMARRGLDVEAYQPIQLPEIPAAERRWNLWVENRRIPAEEWEAEYERRTRLEPHD